MNRQYVKIGIGLLTLSAVVFLHTARVRGRARAVNVESFEKAWTTIRDTYWDPNMEGIDWVAVHDELLPRVEALSSRTEARQVLEEMLERIGRTHFYVIPAEAYGERTGEGDRGVTGMSIRVIDGDVLVTRVVPGSPAERSGVRPGWAVTRVGGDPVEDLLAPAYERFDGTTWLDAELAYAVTRRLNGPMSRTVEVVFLDGADREVERNLGRSTPPGRRYAMGNAPPSWIRFRAGRLAEGEVGYIRFNTFADPVGMMTEFNEAMESFSDTDGVVVDLRGNGGGLGAMVTWMAGWFVRENHQSLGTVYGRDYELNIVVQKRARNYEGPLAILVDGLSASASELFSGGLQGIGRATVIGSRSTGASGPAQITPLPNGDAIVHSTARDVNALGEPIEGVGVTPDVEVAHTREALLEGRDLPLEAAVRWIRKTKEKEL